MKKWMKGLGGALLIGGLIAAASCSAKEETTGSQRSALLDGGGDGGCRQTALTASKSYPAPWSDANESFSPTFKFKIPAELPVVAGNAGNAPATLSFTAGGVAVACNYIGGASVAHPVDSADITAGLKYLFGSCSSGASVGNVVDASSVTVHLDDGDSEAGTTTVTLLLAEEAPCAPPACDPNEAGCASTGEGVFEKRASLIGRVLDKNGNAVTGVTFEVRDLPADTARTDVTPTTDSDGSFRLRLTTFSDHEVPGVGAQHVSLRIDSPNTVRAFRDAWIRPGEGPNLGDIVLVTRDPNVTVIGAAGGTATDSQGLVQVVVPAGALSQNVSIRVTPFLTRSEVTAPLPESTLTTYAFELEPSGTQFAIPVTVKVQNYRAVASNISMPVGVFDPKYGAWEHEATATLVGGMWQFTTTHFSIFDVNGVRVLGDLVTFLTRGTFANKSAEKCVGSTAGLSNGALRQTFALPGVTARGQKLGLTLNYDSGLAGSRRFDYGTTTTHPLNAIGGSSFTVATDGSRSETRCVPRGSTSGASGGSVNACVVGACVFSTVVVPVHFKNWMAGMTLDNDQILDANQTTAETGTFITVPLDDAQQPIGPSFLTRTTRIEVGANTGCAATSTQTFGNDGNSSGTPASLESGAVAELKQKVFIHHRYTSPFGAGWGISEVDRLFQADPDHVIVVNGDGIDEEFRPRGELKLGYQFANSAWKPVFGRDPQTNEIFAVTASGGQLVKVNADLTVTSPVVPTLSLPGRPHDLAITYVNSQRVFIIACDTGLVKVSSTGTVTSLGARTIPPTPSVFNQAHVAVRNDLVFYVSGEPTAKVVKRLRLTDPSPTLVALSVTSGDQRLDPSGALSTVQLGDPTGLAFGNDGMLYLGDRTRNAVYRIEPDGQSEISGASMIHRVIGRQGANFALPVGDRYTGNELPLSAPVHLSTAPDGTLLIATAYGLLQYDPPTANVEWLAYNKNGADSDLTLDWYGGSGTLTGTAITNVVATGPRTMLFGRFQQIMRLDTPLALASVFAPTRTLEPSGGQWFLVDANAGTKEVFDSKGRMLELKMRTNEAVFSVGYDGDLARVATITNAVSGTWHFHYDGSGKLQSVDDPAGRSSLFSVDGNGDLTSFSEPDGEAHVFTYAGHHMLTKESPSHQVTSYEYSANGNLSKSTKPTGEMTTIQASLDAPPQKGPAARRCGSAPTRMRSASRTPSRRTAWDRSTRTSGPRTASRTRALRCTTRTSTRTSRTPAPRIRVSTTSSSCPRPPR